MTISSLQGVPVCGFSTPFELFLGHPVMESDDWKVLVDRTIDNAVCETEVKENLFEDRSLIYPVDNVFQYI